MNIRDLEYFIAVAEENHFGKAAHKCFVSQPTLSGQIKKLETELGVSLFERNNRSVRLSAAGQNILPHVRSMLQMGDEIFSIAQSHADPFAGKLSVGCIPTMAPFYLPLLIPILQEHFPKLDITLFEITTAQIIEKLQEGSLDLGLLALPISLTGLQEVSIGLEDFYLGLSQQNSLAQKKSLTLEVLKEQKLLLLEEGHCFRDQALELCHSAGAKEDKKFQATSLQTLKQIVKLNQGITLVPALAAKEWSEDKSLAMVPFAKPIPTRELGMLFRETSVRKTLFEAMEPLFRKALGQTKEQDRKIIPIAKVKT